MKKSLKKGANRSSQNIKKPLALSWKDTGTSLPPAAPEPSSKSRIQIKGRRKTAGDSHHILLPFKETNHI
jgi:hypothetical protein